MSIWFKVFHNSFVGMTCYWCQLRPHTYNHVTELHQRRTCSIGDVVGTIIYMFTRIVRKYSVNRQKFTFRSLHVTIAWRVTYFNSPASWPKLRQQHLHRLDQNILPVLHSHPSGFIAYVVRNTYIRRPAAHPFTLDFSFNQTSKFPSLFLILWRNQP